MGNRSSISAGFCFFLALMLMVLPVSWVLSMIVAAAFHEFCHFAAIRICGKGSKKINLQFSGAKIDMPNLSSRQELICALAGPVGSLFLVILIRWFPKIAICGVAQGLYNLLPAYPMDGGRALRCCCSMAFSPSVACKVRAIVENGFYILLLLFGGYATIVLRLGLLPMILVLMLCLRTKSGKIPCKLRKERVQYQYYNF